MKNSFLFYVEKVSDVWLRFKYRNEPYIEYYRAIMKRENEKDSRYAVGGKWERGEGQLNRLRMYGLTPEHRMFDIGCGCLRGGLHFIKYLNAGNYAGNDISQEILEAGKVFLREAGLDNKTPRLFFTDNTEFTEVAGESFDYIHAQSVLSHMPPEDIETLFKNVKKIMHPNSQFFASFFLAKKGDMYPSNQRRDFHYPLEWMKDMGKKQGLVVEMVKDIPDSSGKQPLLRITLR